MYEGLISIVPHVPLLRLGEREGESMRKTERERGVLAQHRTKGRRRRREEEKERRKETRGVSSICLKMTERRKQCGAKRRSN